MGGILIKTLRGWAEIAGHTEGLNAGVSAVFSLLVLAILCGLGLMATYAVLRALRWVLVHGI